MKIKANKLAKSILILMVVILLTVGVFWALGHFHVIKFKMPELGIQLPFVQMESSKAKPQSELQRVKEENDILKKTVASKNTEVEKLQQLIEAMDKKQKNYQQSWQDYQRKIVELSKSSDAALEARRDKQSAYKDLAAYFREMNGKEAADLLSRLKEEDIIGVLSEMEADTAADLLQKMPRDIAASIASKMLVTGSE